MFRAMKKETMFHKGQRIQLKKQTGANNYRYLNYKSVTKDSILEVFDEDNNYVYFKVFRFFEPDTPHEVKDEDLIFITKERMLKSVLYKKV